MKLTHKQLIAFAEAFVFANGLRQLARKRLIKDGPLLAYVDIPLTRTFFRRHNRKCRDAILMAFDVFFERAARGHSALPGKSARVSSWRLRTYVADNKVHETIELSGEQMKTIRELYEANRDHIASVHQEVFRSDTKTVVQTTFQFPTPELQVLFEKQVLEDPNLVGEAMKQGTKHTEEAVQKMKDAKAGKPKSPEHKAAISAAQKARWSKMKALLAQVEEKQ